MLRKGEGIGTLTALVLTGMLAACVSPDRVAEPPRMEAERPSEALDLDGTESVPSSTNDHGLEGGGYGLKDLIEDLRDAGATIEPTQRPVDHGFAIEGRRVLVDGAPIFVYEFADVALAESAAAGVSADEYSLTITRSEGERTIETHGDWLETPHVYRKGRLIVIVGDEPNLLHALDAVLGQLTPTPEPRDCSIPNAFPTEEAELTWPNLLEVRPNRVAPGDQVEIRGVGGHLSWDNECGEFRLESARDFQLFFDGEPAGSITCYAHTCLAELTVPVDALPGTHTISVEGGSHLDIGIGESTPAP